MDKFPEGDKLQMLTQEKNRQKIGTIALYLLNKLNLQLKAFQKRKIPLQ